LHDHFTDAHLKLSGQVQTLGICFSPDGFYPFFNIPVSEFRNKLLGAREVGLKPAKTITEKLKEAPDICSRLNILENELAILLVNNQTPQNFRKVFNDLNKNENQLRISEFCRRNNISVRNMERMYNKYVGVSANTYSTLNRFHTSLNRLLISDYSKLSDLAYDNGYFDQMHFIKEFRRFAGNTPKSFVHQNDSILQIGKLT
jgi:AraC-like DNA-binding protein